jgi:hypothetical protein
MSLLPSDPLPTGISKPQAYSAIKKYLKLKRDSFLPENNPPKNLMGNIIPGGEWFDWQVDEMMKTVELIDFLPEENRIQDVEIRAVLQAVISGKLEVAYHHSDGKYKMAAYAEAALGGRNANGALQDSLSPEEIEIVKSGVFGSRLFYA